MTIIVLENVSPQLAADLEKNLGIAKVPERYNYAKKFEEAYAVYKILKATFEDIYINKSQEEFIGEVKKYYEKRDPSRRIETMPEAIEAAKDAVTQIYALALGYYNTYLVESPNTTQRKDPSHFHLDLPTNPPLGEKSWVSKTAREFRKVSMGYFTERFGDDITSIRNSRHNGEVVTIMHTREGSEAQNYFTERAMETAAIVAQANRPR